MNRNNVLFILISSERYIWKVLMYFSIFPSEHNNLQSVYLRHSFASREFRIWCRRMKIKGNIQLPPQKTGFWNPTVRWESGLTEGEKAFQISFPYHLEYKKKVQITPPSPQSMREVKRGGLGKRQEKGTFREKRRKVFRYIWISTLEEKN